MTEFKRNRRTRLTSDIREIFQENRLNISDFIYPIFVSELIDEPKEIESMPGIYQWPLSHLDQEIKEIQKLGLKSVILFGIPLQKDSLGSQAYNPDGIVQKAIRQIKRSAPNLVVIADTCLCEYTDHGHCGQIDEQGFLLNDESVELSVKTAVSQAKAGADIIAPSSCLDGVAIKIREALDESGYDYVSLMGYSIKFASSFYGPFREAADSSPKHGNRKSYQIPFGNQREALRELHSDVEEGVDMVIVKPAMAFMDMVYQTRQNTILPVVVYNVSGEYSMIEAASKHGWIDKKQLILELMMSFKRAGADLIITYHAKEIAKIINNS
ncbi:porphobilinogen synthase [Ignavigranum ruoffiae]|uniref:Delta-aminolevulinic acid dehydratase n=1 Tax=Ignavigranum ruoffiae TaxID=89093 RepID=A0A1H9CGF0_9LACT|nr:porphobilinogen synthase [Ignavigranum ruoffiae]SEQ00224.1 porphobilinogen synthase [Ignavigranum ruoffiae]